MFYNFPIITHIDDVLPAVQGRDEFVVADKGDYIVVNYNVGFEDTFTIDENDMMANKGRAIAKGEMRRELRGIIFDVNGDLISRPAHKFFNLGEREETQLHRVDMSAPHLVLDKLDGSFIRPFKTADGVLRVGTKMGETDVAALAAPFFERPEYRNLAEWCIERDMTPVFEFMSPKARIVVDYGDEDKLVLIFIRRNRCGTYIKYKREVNRGDRGSPLFF